MLKTFIDTMNMKIHYRTNCILFSLKSLPLIKKILPDTLYANGALKVIAFVIGLTHEFISMFFGKALYLAIIFLFASLAGEKVGSANAFMTALLFMSVSGSFVNTKILEPSVDKYYSVVLLRTDSREYALTQFVYFLLRNFIGFVPMTLIFGLLSGVNVWVCLLVPMMVCSMKICATAIMLNLKTSPKNISDKMLGTAKLAIVLICFVCGFLAPVWGFSVNNYVVTIVSVVFFVSAIFAFVNIWNFKKFDYFYKKVLKPENFTKLANNNESTAKYWRKTIKINDKEVDISKESKNVGFKYFNELFMKRHSSLLMKPAKISALIIGLASLIVCAIAVVFPDSASSINEVFMQKFSLIALILYFCNSGARMTQAMFINCDHSMLSYRFYRQPKAILSLFTLRLKYVILVDFIPSLVLAVGALAIVAVSGGTIAVNYVLIFLAIMAMSAFFSVHNMVLYYLMQPYAENMEIKNAFFAIVRGLTYVVCYVFSQVTTSLIWFSSLSIAFCVLYSLIALLLVYKFAPKTFKLRK